MTLPAIAGRVLFGGVRVARFSSVPTLLERLQAGDGARTPVWQSYRPRRCVHWSRQALLERWLIAYGRVQRGRANRARHPIRQAHACFASVAIDSRRGVRALFVHNDFAQCAPPSSTLQKMWQENSGEFNWWAMLGSNQRPLPCESKLSEFKSSANRAI